MDHEDREITFDWTCVGCGKDLVEVGIYQRCDTIVDYSLDLYTNNDGALVGKFSGEGDFCYECDENCKFCCSACRKEITLEQGDALSRTLL